MQQKLKCLFLVFSLISLSFISCKKDNEEAPSKMLVGKWTIEKIEYRDVIDGVPDTYTEQEPGSYLEFKADGTLVAITDDEFTGTWNADDKKVTLVEELNPDDGPITFDIKKLTANELQLYTKEVDGNDYYETTIFLKK